MIVIIITNALMHSGPRSGPSRQTDIMASYPWVPTAGSQSSISYAQALNFSSNTKKPKLYKCTMSACTFCTSFSTRRENYLFFLLVAQHYDTVQVVNEEWGCRKTVLSGKTRKSKIQKHWNSLSKALTPRNVDMWSMKKRQRIEKA